MITRTKYLRVGLGFAFALMLMFAPWKFTDAFPGQPKILNPGGYAFIASPRRYEVRVT
jgi:hypothetical protein